MEAKDNEGFTPFLMASLNGDTLLMRLLVEKGGRHICNKFFES